jgi:hypothetical protein
MATLRDGDVLGSTTLPAQNKKSPRPDFQIEDFVVSPHGTTLCRAHPYIGSSGGCKYIFVLNFFNLTSV